MDGSIGDEERAHGRLTSYRRALPYRIAPTSEEHSQSGGVGGAFGSFSPPQGGRWQSTHRAGALCLPPGRALPLYPTALQHVRQMDTLVRASTNLLRRLRCVSNVEPMSTAVAPLKAWRTRDHTPMLMEGVRAFSAVA